MCIRDRAYADPKSPQPTGSFDRTIEKCQKAIQLHSIKKKPKRNQGKMNDPEYREYIKRDEYNPFKMCIRDRKKGQQVWTGGGDEEAISLGVYKTYTEENLRYSQNAPLDMYKEVNTGCNLPAQIDLYAVDGMEYKLSLIHISITHIQGSQ